MSRLSVLAVVMALACGVASRAWAQHSTPEQAASDINQELRGRGELRAVRATARQGVVTLDGTVARYADKLAAERLAHETAPDAAVRNVVAVSAPRVPDDELRRRVSERLQFAGLDHGMTFHYVDVDARAGVVTLEGKVHGDIDHASAVAIAADVTGVQQVVDHLAVDPSGQRDEDIRVRAARAIYGDPALQRYAADPQPPIRIVVDHGNVTLYGVVANTGEKRIAEMRAREVAGVFSVTNNLLVAEVEEK